jgi:hypothetical protein
LPRRGRPTATLRMPATRSEFCDISAIVPRSRTHLCANNTTSRCERWAGLLPSTPRRIQSCGLACQLYAIGGVRTKSSPRRALFRIPSLQTHAARGVRPRSSCPLSQQYTAPYVALCRCKVTVVAEESPHCGQSGRVCRVFWRQRVPFVLVRLSSAYMITIPWAWTNLPTPQSTVDFTAGAAPDVLLSACALRDLVQFVRNRACRAGKE